jgi:uncharacterized protein involved in exopolysaccharide biosynthesis
MGMPVKSPVGEARAVQHAARARGAAVPMPGDEIDLRVYAGALWRRRYLLIAIAMVVGGVTYAINRAMTPTYEVVFRLMLTQPQLGGEGAGAVNIVPFRELVESPMLAASLLDEFGLRGEPHRITPQRFLASHADVEVIRDSTIIRVAVRLSDPELLVKLANRYAERVVESAQRLNLEGIDYTTDRIKQQRDLALQRLTAAEQSLGDLQRRTQIEVLRQDVDTLLERRPEALDLTVRIQGERARVQQAEAELATQERVRTARRTVDTLPSTAGEDYISPRMSTPASGSPAGTSSPVGSSPDRGAPDRGASGSVPPGREPGPSGSLKANSASSQSATARSSLATDPRPPGQELRIRSEFLDPYVNPVYEALERDLSEARSRLAWLENQRKELVSRLQLEAPTAEKLNRLYEAEARLTALSREQEVARVAYVNAANKFEDARLQSTLRSPRLQILDAALPPDRPVAPRAARNTLAAVLMALALGAIVIIASDRPARTESD